MPHITVEIGPDGSFKIEGHEFKGKDCDKLKAIEAQLGVVQSTALKPEYFNGSGAGVRQQIGGDK